MPTVPRREPGQVPVAPLPGPRATTSAPAGAFGIPTRPDLNGLADSVGKIVDRARKEADETALLAADNALAGGVQDLLENPETGILTRQGTNSFTAPQDAAEGFRQLQDKAEATLKTEQQLTQFRRMAAARALSVRETVNRHVIDQTQRYEQSTFESSIGLAYKEALDAPDPAARAFAMKKTQMLIDAWGDRSGWSPEVRAERQAVAITRVHAAVLSNTISAGQDLAAEQYFAAHQAEMLPDERAKFRDIVDTASSEGKGARAAAKVWGTQGPRTLTDPIKLSTMEDALRTELGDDQRSLKAAIADLRSRTAAFNAEQGEVTASNVNAVLGAHASGRGFSQLATMKEYLALPGAKRDELKESLLRSDEETRERTGYAAFLSLSNPTELLKYSENQIQAMQPSLGRSLTGRLLEMRRDLGTAAARGKAEADAKVIAATIDEDVFKQAARSSGIDPYAEKLTKEQQGQLGQLKMTVLSEIDAAQKTTKRPLSFDEKRAIAQGVVDRKVLVDRFGRDVEISVGVATPDQLGKLYVPLNKVPKHNQLEAANLIRSMGGAANDEMSDADLITRYRSRIERAYAAQLAGATPAAVMAILWPDKEQ